MTMSAQQNKVYKQFFFEWISLHTFSVWSCSETVWTAENFVFVWSSATSVVWLSGPCSFLLFVFHPSIRDEGSQSFAVITSLFCFCCFVCFCFVLSCFVCLFVSFCILQPRNHSFTCLRSISSSSSSQASWHHGRWNTNIHYMWLYKECGHPMTAQPYGVYVVFISCPDSICPDHTLTVKRDDCTVVREDKVEIAILIHLPYWFT